MNEPFAALRNLRDQWKPNFGFHGGVTLLSC